MDVKIDYKDPGVFAKLMVKPYDKKLTALLLWWLKEFHKAVVTESWRKMKHKNDLHGVIPVRAIDLRSWIYENPDGVAERVNSVWIYDPLRPDRKCCVYHDTGSGKHFHLQVHPRTAMKGGE